MESIIGIVSGIIGIVTAVVTLLMLTYNHYKTLPLKDLMTTLVDNNLSRKKHQHVLRKMNRILLVNGNRIKDDYIKNFVLNGRGKETVFMELCDYNNIEPTAELCKRFLDTDLPTFRNSYYAKRTHSTVELNLSTDTDEAVSNENSEEKCQFLSKEELVSQQKQVVYVSELLRSKFPKCYQRLVEILQKHSIEHRFIKGTKDIWCRDYMPVQTESGKLVQFNYDPSYLKGRPDWEASRSDVHKICRENHLKVQFSDINLDGGNVLICSGRAIISDRLFSENPTWKEEVLLKELSDLLECEVIVIPAQKGDVTGHADGMVRFVDRNTILGNNLSAEFKYWRERMEKVIQKYDLRYIDVPFFEAKDPKHKESAEGVYVNYLELKNLLIVPVFNKEQDQQVVNILKSAFPNKQIETIDYTEVAQEGGLLNCSTWVIVESVVP